jgi:prepilin-type N-terminal cleavage/methylation domain-containing protein
MYKQKGFTLIELAIVIMIVGILASVAMPKMTNLGAAATTTAAEEGFQTLRTNFNSQVAVKATATPSDPWPTLMALTGGTAGGYQNSGYNISWNSGGVAGFYSGTSIGGGSAPALASCDKAAIRTFCVAAYPGMVSAIDSGPFSFRTTSSEYVDQGSYFSQRVAPLPAGSCEFINMASIPDVNSSSFVIPGAPDVAGSMPLAADKSGVCVAAGWKARTYKDASGTATSASSDPVQSIAPSPVADAVNC